MPRVKSPPPLRMIDRPGRARLMWRRVRRTLRPLAAGAALLAVLIVAAGTLHSISGGTNFRERLGNATARLGLRVDTVTIEGRQKTPEPLVRAALGVHQGDAILGFSVAAARARLEAINWVQSATVERRLPGTIVVQLVERRPFAVWQHDGKFVLIDRDGNIVTDSDVAAFAGQVPLVVGDGAPKAAAALLDLLATMPELQNRMVAAVRVGDRRWNLRMNNGADVMLPEGAVAPALARLMELQASHALLDRPLQTLDMRLPDRLVLRPLSPDAARPTQAVPGRRPT